MKITKQYVVKPLLIVTVLIGVTFYVACNKSEFKKSPVSGTSDQKVSFTSFVQPPPSGHDVITSRITSLSTLSATNSLVVNLKKSIA